ncbi:unnamed protein product [Phytomonas sp. Hart1]|nr:unnamed protein product [Phytomonas sp. Hart1]|eukprot:CCW71749.1 unnamed protein product [Phytomonas sp. isolate Hart1]
MLNNKHNSGEEYDNSDHWKALTDQLLEDDDQEVLPRNGDLCLPQMMSKKLKIHRKVEKTSLQKTIKSKQKTLDQTLSEHDMEKLVTKYREGYQEDDQSPIDISKYLEDDEEEEKADINSIDFTYGLIDSTNEYEFDVPSNPVTQSDHNTTETPFVKLEDEKFEFESPNAVPKKASSHMSNTSSATYLKVETPVEKVEINGNLLDTGYLSDTLVSEECGDKESNLFYWFDVKEQPYLLSVDPGSLFLFGKILLKENGKSQFCSCCVRVQNVNRCVFLLPKLGSSREDVVAEINDICRSQGIEQRRIKFIERYYAFEIPGIPHERTTWVKLRYPGRYPPFPVKKELLHISAIIGASTSLLELFIIKRKLKGPCFLRIFDLNTALNRMTHCKVEYTVDSPKKIRVEEVSKVIPPFTLASIQIHAQLDSRGATNEVFAATLAIYRNINIENSVRGQPGNILTGVRALSPDKPLPLDFETFCSNKGLIGVHRFNNERQLLIWIANTINSVDADILIGHNFIGFTLDTLLRRFQDLNVPNWSAIGRLQLNRFIRQQNLNLNQEKEFCVGRLVADSYLLAREYFKTVNYGLLSLADEMKLKGITKGRGSFEPGTTILTPEMLSSSENIFEILIQLCNSAVLSATVVFHLDALRLTKRLTNIAGNLWSRTLYGARSERIEYLLLHAFHDLKFITPDKKTFDFKRQRDDEEPEESKRRSKYQGGMVLDPKCGLYSDYILLLDFNSLYPSLIQEFNICFTTVDREGNEDVEIPPPDNLICAACAADGQPFPCPHKCVLPKVIKRLVDSRREVKRLMKSEKNEGSLALLEIRQKALKLIANSMYGCLGFEHSRFFAQKLAELVTRQGRLALQGTVDLIPQINPSLRVIYGDTDSVMIQTGIKDDIKSVREIGYVLRSKINKRYQSLEIDIDGVFRAILLLKKKKYASLSVVDWQEEGKTYKKEVKGLDMVRRDWCPLSKKVSDTVLNRILYATACEDIIDYIVKYVQEVSEHVRLGDRFTLEDFVISKSLTKELESYQAGRLPHVAVAWRMRQRKELVQVGSIIPYVICEGEKSGGEPYHVEEVRRDRNLRIHAEWYLTSQIYPPVKRLCEHIQGFTSTQLGQAMGIAVQAAAPQYDDPIANEVDDFSHCAMFKNYHLSESFPNVVRFQVKCHCCYSEVTIDPHTRVLKFLETTHDSRAPFFLYVCTNCESPLNYKSLVNYFNQLCFTLLREFYQSGGTVAAVRAIRVQFTYFLALFGIPHYPACSSRVEQCHRTQARRCLGKGGKIYTMKEADNPNIKDEFEPEDLLYNTAETFYKRIDHLFVNLGHIFGK